MHHTGSCERSISGSRLVASCCARINRGCKKKESANGAGHESMPIRHSVCRGRGTSYAIGLAPSTFRFPPPLAGEGPGGGLPEHDGHVVERRESRLKRPLADPLPVSPPRIVHHHVSGRDAVERDGMFVGAAVLDDLAVERDIGGRNVSAPVEADPGDDGMPGG